MRIISQDGEMDYPYEKSLVYVDGGEIIVVFNDEENVIATYDTEEKAKAVMELLRYVYCGLIDYNEKIKFVDDGGKATQIKIRMYLTKDKIVFQFPENDEVELCD